jgi:meso-butanediol dehydrogenase/(S,S)-butanediol dehydrogenase/diacetyl reductase
MRFENKVVIVTGAAGGIGKATAVLFAREGAAVVVADIADPSEVVSEIEQAGGRAIGVKGSVASSDFLQKMVDTAVDSYGQIDILINNAGIGIAPGPIETISEEDWDHAFAVNVKSGFLATKFALPHLRKTRGSVLFTASVAGFEGYTNMASYTATKAAIINMARTIALDHAPEGIRVNVVCPGATDTQMVRSVPVPIEAFSNALPLKKLVQPEEIAEAFAYLASAQGASITGQTLAIDGGYSAGDFTLAPSAFEA